MKVLIQGFMVGVLGITAGTAWFVYEAAGTAYGDLVGVAGSEAALQTLSRRATVSLAVASVTGALAIIWTVWLVIRSWGKGADVHAFRTYK